ncbi:hypothetical protein MKK84_00470 [Methylobacterium sp. E-065]|uniref:ribbon-helix-helix domain-containing protein n=1 Tax=Methylobacterium sp. E-065 TaxID=2836583 RepID=UPI001FB9EDF0|nr:ribbon-helix-helix domain-containing protein [Methylobacterium sp. E-065]MCJ2015915.1 hypothetical protein [Methylobacterium sp. E-065]
MSKPARGSLASMAVPKAVTPPPGPAPAVAVSATEVTREAVVQPVGPTPRRAPADMKTVQVRINKQGWRALRDLASDNDTSLEALMVDALNDVLLKNQRPPIVQRRVGERGQEREE